MIIIATKKDNLKIVPYYALKNPSDPSYILSLIFFISSVPVSYFNIHIAQIKEIPSARKHNHIEITTKIIAYDELNNLRTRYSITGLNKIRIFNKRDYFLGLLFNTI
jgi:hypothetical protein